MAVPWGSILRAAPGHGLRGARPGAHSRMLPRHRIQSAGNLEWSAPWGCFCCREWPCSRSHAPWDNPQPVTEWGGERKAWPFLSNVGHSAGQRSPQGSPLGLPGLCWVYTVVWLIPSPNPAFSPFLLQVSQNLHLNFCLSSCFQRIQPATHRKTGSVFSLLARGGLIQGISI